MVEWGWRELCYEWLHGLYSTPNIIQMTSRRMRWTDHVARVRESEKCTQEEKRPLGRRKRRWEDIKRDFQEL